MEQEAFTIEQDVTAGGESSDRNKIIHYKPFTAGAIKVATETNEYP